MSKARPGVCGRCGVAVIQPETPPENGWANGHLFVKGQLTKVRCSACTDPSEPGATEDARGGRAKDLCW